MSQIAEINLSARSIKVDVVFDGSGRITEVRSVGGDEKRHAIIGMINRALAAGKSVEEMIVNHNAFSDALRELRAIEIQNAKARAA